MKAWMDGSNTSVTTVISGSEHLAEPNGLAIDYEAEVLYWTDSALYRITAYDLLTGNTHILIQGYANVPYPYAIGVSQVSSR